MRERDGGGPCVLVQYWSAGAAVFGKVARVDTVGGVDGKSTRQARPSAVFILRVLLSAPVRTEYDPPDGALRCCLVKTFRYYNIIIRVISENISLPTVIY